MAVGMSRHTSCGPGPFLHDESCLDSRLENSGDADNVDADALDEIRGFDRFEDGALVMIVEEHSLKSQMPYSTPLPSERITTRVLATARPH